MEILQVKNLSFCYPKSQNKAVDSLSLALDKGSFNLLIGQSGCGKSTLLRLIKKEIAPFGDVKGEIFYSGTNISKLEKKISASEIGYVGQFPDEQIITDKVWHELSFGCENLGIDTNEIRRRVGEMASYFGITDWYHKNTNELSGGQKQILNLASVLIMRPKLLLLDEPTSQLDPIAASEFLSTIKKVNDELGITVLLVEHRLEEAFSLADKVFVMEKGKVSVSGTPENVCEMMKDDPLYIGFPSAARIWSRLNTSCSCPLTVKDGKRFLEENYPDASGCVTLKRENCSKKYAVDASGIWFRYEKNSGDILQNFGIKVIEGEIFTVVGGNGTGKTTALNAISGILTPYKGKCLINGKKISSYKNNTLYKNLLAMLPQNPKDCFIKDTVYDDFTLVLESLNVQKENYKTMIDDVTEKLEISTLLNKNPCDLSGGEVEKCAIAKLLLTKPKIMLMDEPTKGLDAYVKAKLSKLLLKLKKEGITIIIVSHDIEFSAQVSDRCALFFDGELLSTDSPNSFFSGNNFYTTAANRIAREHFPNAVLCDEVTELLSNYDG